MRHANRRRQLSFSFLCFAVSGVPRCVGGVWCGVVAGAVFAVVGGCAAAAGGSGAVPGRGCRLAGMCAARQLSVTCCARWHARVSTRCMRPRRWGSAARVSSGSHQIAAAAAASDRAGGAHGLLAGPTADVWTSLAAAPGTGTSRRLVGQPSPGARCARGCLRSPAVQTERRRVAEAGARRRRPGAAPPPAQRRHHRRRRPGATSGSASASPGSRRLDEQVGLADPVVTVSPGWAIARVTRPRANRHGARSPTRVASPHPRRPAVTPRGAVKSRTARRRSRNRHTSDITRSSTGHARRRQGGTDAKPAPTPPQPPQHQQQTPHHTNHPTTQHNTPPQPQHHHKPIPHYV